MSEPELISTWTGILFVYRLGKLIHQIRGSDLRLTRLRECPGEAPRSEQ